MRRPSTAIWITAGVLLLGPILVPLAVPWSPINCRHQDMNIKSGKVRNSRQVWFMTVSTTIEDTPLSAALDGTVVDAADIEPWHRVNTFTPWLRHSPHYVFHGALAQAQTVGMAFEMLQPDQARRREIAGEILRLWQTTARDSGADGYIARLMDEEIRSLEQPDSLEPAGHGMVKP